MAIAREHIVAQALNLLDEVGIDALSTRKLAERLGVQQPALYWHFKNKRALLDAMNDAMLASHEAESVPRAGEDWRGFLRRHGNSLRDALLSRRQGGTVHAGSPPSDGDEDRMRVRFSFLLREGFSPRLAIEATLSVHHFVMGNVIDEQADREAGIGWDLIEPGYAPADDPLDLAYTAMASLGRNGMFASGLELLLDGIAQRLASSTAEGREAGVDAGSR